MVSTAVAVLTSDAVSPPPHAFDSVWVRWLAAKVWALPCGPGHVLSHTQEPYSVRKKHQFWLVDWSEHSFTLCSREVCVYLRRKCRGVPCIPWQAVPLITVEMQQLHGHSCCSQCDIHAGARMSKWGRSCFCAAAESQLQSKGLPALNTCAYPCR